MMLLRNSFTAFLILVVFYGCVKKIKLEPVKDPLVVLAKVSSENQKICEYNRKGVFYYEDRFNRVKFKGYLKKQCNDDFYLAVLGGFNQQVMEVKGSKENVEITSSQIKDTKSYMGLFNKNNISSILKVLNYPYVLPDEGFSFSYTEDTYIFSKDTTQIFVGADFKIKRIKDGTSEIYYTYDEILKQIEMKNTDIMMSVRFF